MRQLWNVGSIVPVRFSLPVRVSLSDRSLPNSSARPVPSSTKYFRLARTLDIFVQGRVSHLCFPEQGVESPPERFVVGKSHSLAIRFSFL
jgi:hypothetical protein